MFKHKLNERPQFEKTVGYAIKYGKDRYVNLGAMQQKWRRRLETVRCIIFSVDREEVEKLFDKLKARGTSKKIEIETIPCYKITEYVVETYPNVKINEYEQVFTEKPKGYQHESLKEIISLFIEARNETIKHLKESIEETEQERAAALKLILDLEVDEELKEFIA